METLDPVLVDALSASIQVTGVAALWIGGLIGLIGLTLLVLVICFYDDEERVMGGLLFGLVLVIGLGIVACHVDDTYAPRYEAMKQLNNRIVNGRMLPSGD